MDELLKDALKIVVYPHLGFCWVLAELIEGNGYEGRQTSKGELFVKVFGMSRDFEGAHIDFKMAASVCV